VGDICSGELNELSSWVVIVVDMMIENKIEIEMHSYLEKALHEGVTWCFSFGKYSFKVVG
jgi:hypothetical protein